MMNKPEPYFRGKHKKRSHLIFLESKNVQLYDLENLHLIIDQLFQDLQEDYYQQRLIFPDYNQLNNRGLSLYVF